MIDQINEIIYFHTSEHDDVIDYLWEEYLKLKGKKLTTLSSVNKKMVFEKQLDKPLIIRIFTRRNLSDKVIKELQIKRKKYKMLDYIKHIADKKHFTVRLKLAVR